eukprot:TRINITY_DN13546_c0_g2_i1.p1 TRINITY_DN13546_c0_g2~~TRINITY_DN13546_c0_g2_i1.p1  ORF type:complete len:189 (+),score=28.67 TRINITY_DN13546_c0_g2_i1:234-800(+)
MWHSIADLSRTQAELGTLGRSQRAPRQEESEEKEAQTLRRVEAAIHKASEVALKAALSSAAEKIGSALAQGHSGSSCWKSDLGSALSEATISTAESELVLEAARPHCQTVAAAPEQKRRTVTFSPSSATTDGVNASSGPVTDVECDPVCDPNRKCLDDCSRSEQEPAAQAQVVPPWGRFLEASREASI